MKWFLGCSAVSWGNSHFFLLPQQVSWGKYKSFFVKALFWSGYGKYEFPQEKWYKISWGNTVLLLIFLLKLFNHGYNSRWLRVKYEIEFAGNKLNVYKLYMISPGLLTPPRSNHIMLHNYIRNLSHTHKNIVPTTISSRNISFLRVFWNFCFIGINKH